MAEDTLDFKVSTDPQGKLSETVTHSSIRRTDKKKLDVQTVTVLNPDTGELVSFFPVPRDRADATLNQVNPVSATEYIILDTTKNVRIITAMAVCTWTVQPTPLDLKMYIDGQVLTFTVNNPVSTTTYDAAMLGGGILNTLATGDLPRYRAFLIEGRSIKITALITGGTVSNLSGRVKYETW